MAALVSLVSRGARAEAPRRRAAAVLARALCAGGAGGCGGADPDPRAALLDAALAHVPASGWSPEALRAGAADAGLSPAAVGLLPRGEAELVEHFHARCDADLARELEGRSPELADMRVRDRLALAVRLRLEMVGPVLHTWPQALALQALPPNAPHALRLRAALVDEMWHAAGDTTTDMRWYARRAALGAVYSATEVAMLTDFSPAFEDTWAFLDRRIDDATELGKATREAADLASAALRGLVGRPADRREA